MDEAGEDFRATKDIDMILIIENRPDEFAKVFWEYIHLGEYRNWAKSSDQANFYRFTGPKPGYPVMIELFSRRPDYIADHKEGHPAPLHVSDEISSLSAILLNDDYYELMLSGRKVIDDISVLGAEYLIPFKVRAWLDLTRQREEGVSVQSKDIKKHRNDVFRLYSLLSPALRILLPIEIKNDIRAFLEEMMKLDAALDMTIYGLRGISLLELITSLRDIYLSDIRE